MTGNVHARCPARERALLLAAFAAICFVWGSTFLAIRYAVAAIPPLALMGLVITAPKPGAVPRPATADDDGTFAPASALATAS